MFTYLLHCCPGTYGCQLFYWHESKGAGWDQGRGFRGFKSPYTFVSLLTQNGSPPISANGFAITNLSREWGGDIAGKKDRIWCAPLLWDSPLPVAFLPHYAPLPTQFCHLPALFHPPQPPIPWLTCSSRQWERWWRGQEDPGLPIGFPSCALSVQS